MYDRPPKADSHWLANHTMFSLTLVVIVGAVGAHIRPRLRQFPDGQPLVQGQLEARHGQALDCKHFKPGRCVQNWGVVRGTGPAVTAGPVFLGDPCRHLR